MACCPAADTDRGPSHPEPLPCTLARVGVVRIHLDSGRYERVDAEMISRGYATTILGIDDEGADRQLALPVGSYWRDEPTDERDLRSDAEAACAVAGETVGVQILATAGLSAWRGLVPIDWPS